MSIYPALSPKEMVKLLEKHGFVFKLQKGSHQIFTKDEMISIVPMHSKVLKSGTQRNIIKSTGMSQDEFFEKK